MKCAVATTAVFLFATQHARTIGETVLLAVGGDSNGGIRSATADLYVPLANRWYRVARMTKARSGVAVGTIDNVVHAIGGEPTAKEQEQHHNQAMGSVEQYDASNNIWQPARAMLSRRAWHAVAVLDRQLFAIGGFDQTYRVIKDVEALANGSWTAMPSMQTPRAKLAAVALGACVYALGGQNWSWRQLASAERLCPGKGRWEYVEPMPEARWQQAAAVLNGQIYSCGGYTGGGTREVNSCIRYSPVTDTWTSTSPIPSQRRSLAMAVIGDTLYQCGGYDGGMQTDSLSAFQSEAAGWTSLETMNRPRWGLGVAVLNVSRQWLQRIVGIPAPPPSTRDITDATSTTAVTRITHTTEATTTSEPPPSTSLNQWLTLLVILSPVVAFACACVGLCAACRWRRANRANASLALRLDKLESALKRSGDTQKIDLTKPLQEQLDCLEFKSEYEVERSRLRLDGSTLGEGNFGRVLGGQLLPTGQRIACKTVLDVGSFEQLRMLLAELKVHMHIDVPGHRHVIALLGACLDGLSSGREPYVILELAAKGSLKRVLQQRSAAFVNLVGDDGELMTDDSHEFSTTNLLAWSYQLADGMAYLASRHLIHRDLAARNVLVSCDDAVKIADFGLARRCRPSALEYQRALGNDAQPLRWMAPECLQAEQSFTEQSDVWSYGVVLWEIFTLGGEMPYADVPMTTEFVDGIIDGTLRLQRPAIAPTAFFQATMSQCWHLNAADRPRFAEIKSGLVSAMSPRAFALAAMRANVAPRAGRQRAIANRYTSIVRASNIGGVNNIVQSSFEQMEGVTLSGSSMHYITPPPP